MIDMPVASGRTDVVALWRRAGHGAIHEVTILGFVYSPVAEAVLAIVMLMDGSLHRAELSELRVTR